MLATVGNAGKAEAGFYSGSTLLKYCESSYVAETNTCGAYLMGIDDITETYYFKSYMDRKFCVPDKVMSTQLQKVVIKGLSEMPEQLHLNASGLVYNIFAKAFPCG